MNSLFKPLLLLAALGCTQCTTKQDDAAPVNPIAANTAAVTVDGTAFPVDLRQSAVFINARTGELSAGLNSSDPRGPFVSLRVVEFRNRVEQIQFMSGSASEIVAGAGFLPGSGSDYGTNFCGTRNQAVEIVAFNQTNKTVSVRFSGTACGGQNGTQQKLISSGQFNLPYTLR